MSFWRRDYFLPLALVVVGVFLLLRNLNLLDWLDGKYVWPVVLIVLGVLLILRRTRV
jgi:drug/metabolite transporter (DMT)-like permease